MVAVTGVSGSGKSSLVTETLAPALLRELHGTDSTPGAMDGITGAGGGSVDGMALEVHLEVLEELRVIALDGMS